MEKYEYREFFDGWVATRSLNQHEAHRLTSQKDDRGLAEPLAVPGLEELRKEVAHSKRLKTYAGDGTNRIGARPGLYSKLGEGTA